MTKRQAIEKCEKMWRLMSKDKDCDYEAKRRIYYDCGGKSYDCYGHCFACDYIAIRKTAYCWENCILISIWGGRHCNTPKSPYYKWENAKTLKTRKKYALIIADGCKELLKGEK